MQLHRLWVSLAIMLGCASAVAQDSSPRVARFTDRGRTSIAGAISGKWSSAYHGELRTWSVAVAPSVTRFIRDGVGLGATARYSIAGGAGGLGGLGSRSTRSSSAGVGVSGIFELPLREQLGLLAMPALLYTTYWNASSELAPVHGLSFHLHVPLVYHLSGGFALGIGPSFSVNKSVIDQEYALILGQRGSSPTYELAVSSFIGTSF